MDLSKHTQRPRRTQQALHTASQGAYAPVCKGMFTTPPPVNISQHFGLPNNCARIGSLLSAPAACYMHAPAPEPQGVDLRAPAEAPLGRGALCSFIASVKKWSHKDPSPSGRTFFLLPYSPTPFLVGLAGTPQASKREIWSLREPRKRQNERFGLCGNPASLTEFIAIYTQHLKPRIYA